MRQLGSPEKNKRAEMGMLRAGTRNTGCSQCYAVCGISARLLQQCHFFAPFIYVSLRSSDHLTLDSLSAVSLRVGV